MALPWVPSPDPANQTDHCEPLSLGLAQHKEAQPSAWLDPQLKQHQLPTLRIRWETEGSLHYGRPGCVQPGAGQGPEKGPTLLWPARCLGLVQQGPKSSPTCPQAKPKFPWGMALIHMTAWHSLPQRPGLAIRLVFPALLGLEYVPHMYHYLLLGSFGDSWFFQWPAEKALLAGGEFCPSFTHLLFEAAHSLPRPLPLGGKSSPSQSLSPPPRPRALSLACPGGMHTADVQGRKPSFAVGPNVAFLFLLLWPAGSTSDTSGTSQ